MCSSQELVEYNNTHQFEIVRKLESDENNITYLDIPIRLLDEVLFTKQDNEAELTKTANDKKSIDPHPQHENHEIVQFVPQFDLSNNELAHWISTNREGFVKESNTGGREAFECIWCESKPLGGT